MPTQLLETHGGRVAYETFGHEGPAIVAVPGLGDTRATWRVLGPVLADAGYRFIAVDLRGHGESDVSFEAYTPEGIGDDVVALLEAQDLRDVVLVGNSIGGAAIVRAALTSDRIAALVHVNPFVRDMPADGWLRPLVPLLFGGPWGTWAWGSYRRTLFASPPTDQAENHAAVLRNLAEPGRMAAVRGMLRASKAGIAAQLDALRVPSLVIMGASDPDYADPVAEGENLRQLLPDVVDVVVVEATGHYPQIERPDEVARALRPHLDRWTGRGA